MTSLIMTASAVICGLGVSNSVQNHMTPAGDIQCLPTTNRLFSSVTIFFPHPIRKNTYFSSEQSPANIQHVPNINTIQITSRSQIHSRKAVRNLCLRNIKNVQQAIISHQTPDILQSLFVVVQKHHN